MLIITELLPIRRHLIVCFVLPTKYGIKRITIQTQSVNSSSAKFRKKDGKVHFRSGACFAPPENRGIVCEKERKSQIKDRLYEYTFECLDARTFHKLIYGNNQKMTSLSHDMTAAVVNTRLGNILPANDMKY